MTLRYLYSEPTRFRLSSAAVRLGVDLDAADLDALEDEVVDLVVAQAYRRAGVAVAGADGRLLSDLNPAHSHGLVLAGCMASRSRRAVAALAVARSRSFMPSEARRVKAERAYRNVKDAGGPTAIVNAGAWNMAGFDLADRRVANMAKLVLKHGPDVWFDAAASALSRSAA
jgi:hypothetical protein